MTVGPGNPSIKILIYNQTTLETVHAKPTTMHQQLCTLVLKMFRTALLLLPEECRGGDERQQGLHTPWTLWQCVTGISLSDAEDDCGSCYSGYGNFTERKWNRGLKTKNTMGDGREESGQPERETDCGGVWLWKRGRGEGKRGAISVKHIFFSGFITAWSPWIII